MSGGDEVCSQHPCAPHGFNRNGSHSEDRYVCDCEGWRPDRTCAGLELLQRAETAEAALLAKSAEYDALVARAYQEGWHECAEWAGRDDLHPDVDSKAYEVARDKRLARLLVLDDRPSHTAGENDA